MKAVVNALLENVSMLAVHDQCVNCHVINFEYIWLNSLLCSALGCMICRQKYYHHIYWLPHFKILQPPTL